MRRAGRQFSTAINGVIVARVKLLHVRDAILAPVG